MAEPTNVNIANNTFVIPLLMEREFMNQLESCGCKPELQLTNQGFQLLVKPSPTSRVMAFSVTPGQAADLIGGCERWRDRQTVVNKLVDAEFQAKQGNMAAAQLPLNQVYTYRPRTSSSRDATTARNTLAQITRGYLEVPSAVTMGAATRRGSMVNMGLFPDRNYGVGMYGYGYRPNLLTYLGVKMAGGYAVPSAAYPYNASYGGMYVNYNETLYDGRRHAGEFEAYSNTFRHVQRPTATAQAPVDPLDAIEVAAAQTTPSVEDKYGKAFDGPITSWYSGSAYSPDVLAECLRTHNIAIDIPQQGDECSIIVRSPKADGAEGYDYLSIPITRAQAENILPQTMSVKNTDGLQGSVNALNTVLTQYYETGITAQQLQDVNKRIDLRLSSTGKQLLATQSQPAVSMKKGQEQGVDQKNGVAGEMPYSMIPRPERVITLDEAFGPSSYYESNKYSEVLASHGIWLSEAENGKYQLMVQSSSLSHDLVFDIDEQTARKIVPLTKENGPGLDIEIARSLNTINGVLEGTYADRITFAQLNSDKIIDISLRNDVMDKLQDDITAGRIKVAEAYLNPHPTNERCPVDELTYLQIRPYLETRKAQVSTTPEGYYLVNVADYHAAIWASNHGLCETGGFAEVSPDKAFYYKEKGGRQVSISHIEAVQQNGGRYYMQYMLNGEMKTQPITEKEFNHFNSLNDKARLEYFDKLVDEVKIKSIKDEGAKTLYFGEKAGNNVAQGEAEHAGVVRGADLMYLDATKDFYVNVKNGKSVTVGDVWVSSNDNGCQLNAEINGQIKRVEISAKDYDKYLKSNDLTRLTMAAQVLSPDISIKDRAQEEKQANANKIDITNNYANGQAIEAQKKYWYDKTSNSECLVGDIRVIKGNIEGTYKMEAVILRPQNGEMVRTLETRDITQKEYTKFLQATTEKERLKVFDKTFKDIESKDILPLTAKVGIFFQALGAEMSIMGQCPDMYGYGRPMGGYGMNDRYVRVSNSSVASLNYEAYLSQQQSQNQGLRIN